MKAEYPYLEDGNIRVEWVNLNEGNEGDYDPSNPYDVNLLRFDVSTRVAPSAPWEEVPDGSYCTLVPASTDHETLMKLLKLIVRECKSEIESFGKAKRILERLSWLRPQDAQLIENYEPA